MKIIFIFCFIGTWLFADASQQSTVENHFTKNGVRLQDLSIVISSSASNDLLAKIGADNKKIPASITKLFTAAAVLSKIPPGTKLKTKITTDAKIEGTTLKGPIYLIGGGDPGFVSETMWFLVNAFTRNKINKIEGDIVVDDSLFDSKRFDDSREAARADRAYDAPVGAMSFNWNSVNIFMRPGQNGNTAEVYVDPENEYIVLESKLTRGSKNAYQVDRIPFDDGRDKIRVSGSIVKDGPELVVFKSISQPDLWSGYNLKSFLKQRGIEVTGKVRIGRATSSAKLLAEAESKPIESMVSDMNKFSNNFVAEMLTKQLATTNGAIGSIAEGMKVIRSVALERGVSESEIELYNPSGLTRENSFSARSLHKLLESVRKDFRVFPEFISSLPISGVDGTLKNRLKNGNGARWIRAKTGLLTGVTALAGYAGRPNGEILSFVMIYNGSEEGAKIRNLFDSLLENLIH